MIPDHVNIFLFIDFERIRLNWLGVIVVISLNLRQKRCDQRRHIYWKSQ